MSRQYQIFGEAMVYLRFGSHVPFALGVDSSDPNIWELGLTSEAITITPNFNYKGINIDSYGPNVPADVLSQIADALVEFSLVHWDDEPMKYWEREGLAGGSAGFNDPLFVGTMNYAGVPLGAGLPLYASGNHYVGLGLANPTKHTAFRFPATYLNGPPVKFSIGTARSIIECKAQSLPYAPLHQESHSLNAISDTFSIPIFGNILWDNNLLNGNPP